MRSVRTCRNQLTIGVDLHLDRPHGAGFAVKLSLGLAYDLYRRRGVFNLGLNPVRSHCLSKVALGNGGHDRPSASRNGFIPRAAAFITSRTRINGKRSINPTFKAAI